MHINTIYGRFTVTLPWKVLYKAETLFSCIKWDFPLKWLFVKWTQGVGRQFSWKKYTFISPKLKLLFSTTLSPILYTVKLLVLFSTLSVTLLVIFFFPFHIFFSSSKLVLNRNLKSIFCTLTFTFSNDFAFGGTVLDGQKEIENFNRVFRVALTCVSFNCYGHRKFFMFVAIFKF